jgi:hypothetical protein
LIRNRLLKHVIAGKIKVTEDEEEDVSNYWLKLGKQEVVGN